MDPMLEAFLSESRDNLETAGKCFLELENSPSNKDLMDELFRAVHTIKGSSGLFDIVPFTKVVHAAEDILDSARAGEFSLESSHIDTFLDAFDQIMTWLDSLERTNVLPNDAETVAARLSSEFNCIVQSSNSVSPEPNAPDDEAIELAMQSESLRMEDAPDWLGLVKENVLLDCYKETNADKQVYIITYQPDAGCFFSGDDPLHFVKTIPGLKCFVTQAIEKWSDPMELDPFTCNLLFKIMVVCDVDTIHNHFRYIPDQINITLINPTSIILITGEMGDQSIYEDFCEQASKLVESENIEGLLSSIENLLPLSGETLYQTKALHWLEVTINKGFTDKGLLNAIIDAMKTGQLDMSSLTLKQASPTANKITNNHKLNVEIENLELLKHLMQSQVSMIQVADNDDQLRNKIASVIRLFNSALPSSILAQLEYSEYLDEEAPSDNKLMLISSIERAAALAGSYQTDVDREDSDELLQTETVEQTQGSINRDPTISPAVAPADVPDNTTTSPSLKKTSDSTTNKVLRVDQAKIDSIMDLVGELIVAKNALPYLAKRAEDEYGIRPLAKEIKSQYAALNRLSDELQSAVMQIRMVPMSSVFQRFPRLVRDLARKLNKNIQLNLEGEDTEADKNVVEELADPLIHLIRNSLDHGLEMPQDRIAAGKPAQGNITLRAIPKDDQVIIEVSDDGKGIDPEVIKRKAYEKGVIDEERLESITDFEAIQLIFAPGFSTAEKVSDLSGRGVGMDVVKTVIHASGGTVVAHSEIGKGSTMRLTLPLSMAVTRVMMLDVGSQLYGISMENIVETVRVPKSDVQGIKAQRAIVLRERLIPLFDLRQLLNVEYKDSKDELAILVMRYGGEEIGLVIDEFHEGVDIIQKPLEGVIAGFSLYSGTALLGDGRVLLVLNIPELVGCQ